MQKEIQLIKFLVYAATETRRADGTRFFQDEGRGLSLEVEGFREAERKGLREGRCKTRRPRA
jgi:hypothetical protein